MNKRFSLFCVLLIFSSFFHLSAQSKEIQNEYENLEIPWYWDFQAGVSNYFRIPMGLYAESVGFEDGFALNIDYFLPVEIYTFPLGLTFNMGGGFLIPKDSSITSGGIFDMSIGTWLLIPLSDVVSIQPDFTLGFTTRSFKAKKLSKNSYTDALLQVGCGIRWNPKNILNGDFEVVGEPYFGLVPFKDNPSVFMGLKAGVSYKLGRCIYISALQRSQRAEQDLQARVKAKNISGITIRRSKKGIILAIENIQFLANSAELAKSEKAKLDKLCEILVEMENELLVTGHCSDAGSSENNMRISAERAGSVADYIIQKGARKADQIYITGRGSLEPVADDSTAEGRAKNRRVEITLLDKGKKGL